MYVTPVLRNTWMYTVNVYAIDLHMNLHFLSVFCPFPSCPFSVFHTDLHIHKSTHYISQVLSQIQIVESLGYLKLP